jgi:ParB-like chromosome segregation protein Spo0J
MNAFRNLSIEVVPLASLKPYARNPHTHSAKQIRQIAESIRQFGFTNAILIDRDGGVVAGHGRIEAAKLLGMPEVPTVRLDQMTEAQKRAYIIADNKLAENAGWDRELLALELQYISELDLDFDLTITGFEAAEIDVLLEGGDAGALDEEADDLSEVDESGPSVSRVGDLWILGQHRLLCADATRAESFNRLLGGELAQQVFVDPP